VRDIVIGMSDGLTVPFALATGLSGAVDSTGLIITVGLAEVAAGAMAMGLRGYRMVTLLALFMFGFVKGRFTTNRPVRSAWQTVLVGGLAAVAAFTSARMIR
jgi:VIT1/CCC1 family predicted Fe2+/Mn2+ transporter